MTEMETLRELSEYILQRCPPHVWETVPWPGSANVRRLNMKSFTTTALRLNRVEYRLESRAPRKMAWAAFPGELVPVMVDPGVEQYYAAETPTVLVTPDQDVDGSGYWKAEQRYGEMVADSAYILIQQAFEFLKQQEGHGVRKLSLDPDDMAARLAPFLLAPDRILCEMMRVRQGRPFLLQEKIIPMADLRLIGEMATALQIPADILIRRLTDAGYLQCRPADLSPVRFG